LDIVPLLFKSMFLNVFLSSSSSFFVVN